MLASTFDEGFFKIKETKQWINNHGYQRVALQLPDSLLRFAPELSKAFHEFKTFVLADTSYGECCVDQIAAAHNNANCVIHYGRSCLSRPTYLPTFLVFCDLGKDVDIERTHLNCMKEFTSIFIEIDVRYEGLRTALHNLMSDLGIQSFELSKPPPSELIPLHVTPDNLSTNAGCDYSEHYQNFEAVLFVGPSQCPQLDKISFTCATLTERQPKVFSLNPETHEVSARDSNRSLAKRYILVEKVRDSTIIGILIGTLSAAGYNPVLDRVKSIIQRSGRKSYSFVFGKLTPSKLANFPDVDSFVLVACPFNTLIDSREFNKPIVTPYELEVALNNRTWGSFVWDFSALLSEDIDQGEIKKDREEDEVRYSLSSGKMVQIKKRSHDPNTTLTLRYESPAAESLAEKTFRGLDPTVEQMVASKARPGQYGVATELYQMDDKDRKKPI